MQQQFRRLIDKFCAITGLDEPDNIAEGSSFSVDDVECAVIYQRDVTPEVIYCYIDFGLPQENLLNEVYEKLLKANFLQFVSIKATFSMSPHTGHVILVSTLQLVDATAEMLAEHLSNHAQQALEWRDHFIFLPSEISPVPNAISTDSTHSPFA